MTARGVGGILVERNMAVGEAAQRSRISYAAYLEIERESGRRHEWLDGQVYAMAGGSLSHSALAVAVAAKLLRLSRACGCQVFSSDAKVRVLATGLATYPDVSVVCGRIERDPDDTAWKHHTRTCIFVAVGGSKTGDATGARQSADEP
jgi:Uma2 family endonuclease